MSLFHEFVVAGALAAAVGTASAQTKPLDNPIVEGATLPLSANFPDGGRQSITSSARNNGAGIFTITLPGGIETRSQYFNCRDPGDREYLKKLGVLSAFLDKLSKTDKPDGSMDPGMYKAYMEKSRILAQEMQDMSKYCVRFEVK